MDPADLLTLQSPVAALANCLAKGADMFDRWRASGDVLEVFRWVLDPGIPILQEVWKAARKIHYAAAVDIFGTDSAVVSAMLHQTLTSPFASPVSFPVMPSPQPAAIPKPAAPDMLQPAAAVLHQPATADTPQPAAAVRYAPAR